MNKTPASSASSSLSYDIPFQQGDSNLLQRLQEPPSRPSISMRISFRDECRLEGWWPAYYRWSKIGMEKTQLISDSNDSAVRYEISFEGRWWIEIREGYIRSKQGVSHLQPLIVSRARIILTSADVRRKFSYFCLFGSCLKTPLREISITRASICSILFFVMVSRLKFR